ncbi:MAG: hypothetical protein Q9Q40_15645, partial [Acidobacteriota bacterium]|nr:hypothetical protein [Acidobacteriota bacterium]
AKSLWVTGSGLVVLFEKGPPLSYSVAVSVDGGKTWAKRHLLDGNLRALCPVTVDDYWLVDGPRYVYRRH